MDYQKILEQVVQSVDGVEHEINTEVRQEFSEFSDDIDIVLEAFKCLDRDDLLYLQHQMMEIQLMMKFGASCECENIRWHACLGRMETAVAHGAMRSKTGLVNLMVEEGILTPEAVALIEGAISKLFDDELPDLPEGITIPDDPSELSKDA